MPTKQKARPVVKDIVINHKSHVQKKYFSLMLVPSYTGGKTRSIRIPYRVFYFGIAAVLLVSAVIFSFYLRSSYYERAAIEAGASLDEAHEAYHELQADLQNEQSRLQEEQNRLKEQENQLTEQLTEAEKAKRTEINQQTQTYQENLDVLAEQAEEMEKQLQELDNYRLEKLDKLEVKAFIPPVKELLDESKQAVSLSYLHGVDVSSDERSGSVYFTEDDLRDYYSLLSMKRDSVIENYAGLENVITEASPYIKNYPTMRPVSGSISSNFGYRTDPLGGRNRQYHDAVDISCSNGTNVIATGGGTVLTAKWSGGYGYFIVIDHGFGIQTAYAHNSKLLVEAGDKVARGDIIAKSGSTGNSTGPHIHYEVRVNGVGVDPKNYFLE
jgi:murein DD-endopeptidase MepM/ murein hydrolase activator NlpD